MSSRSDSLRAVESEVGRLIRRVRRVIGERARAVDAGLSAGGYLMLAHLDEVGPLRSTALAEVLGMDKGAVSRQVQHLVDLGLVARTPDPDDGRATLLSASPQAHDRLLAVHHQRSARFDRRMADWSDAELAELAAGLARYNTSLDDNRD